MTQLQGATFHRGLVRALRVLAAVTSMLATVPVSAQFRLERRADGSLFYARAQASADEVRWRSVAFPARTRRTVRQANRPGDLDRRRALYAGYFAEAARLYQLPVQFLHAVAHVESSFNPAARSGDGAMGLMQLMPFTAKEMGISDPHDPRQNVFGGARFLRLLANQWKGNLVLTIAAYNAGSGAVRRHRGVPPFAETQRYVRRVLDRFRFYSGQPGPGR